MDIDFPLILTWAVIVCGAIWGFDYLFLRPARVAAADGVPGGEDDAEAAAAREALLKEPLLVEYAHSFFPVLLIVLVLRSFLIEPYQIPSASMVPTLQVGDFILVNKFAYGLRLPVLGTKIVDIGEPARGDVMVFIPPHDPRYFIKRVIGLPGDVITYENKHLTINGQEMPLTFLANFPPLNPQYQLFDENLDGVHHMVRHFTHVRSHYHGKRWVVPAGHYFMMGDNRDDSDDSRRWGFVPEKNIVGKAFAIWIHKDPGWHLPTFARNGMIH